MLAKRVIVCLDVQDARVVKGTRFVDLRDVGDPVELAEAYEREGADEIVFLDITASVERRQALLDVARRTAERLFIPLTIGGGMRTVGDIALALRAGADKVGVNSAAVARPALLAEAAAKFGSQCVVASIDAKRSGESWEVYVNGGRRATGLDAIECIASGGAGGAAHIPEAIVGAGADAALVAGILHDGVTTVRAIKAAMSHAGVPVRETA